MNFDCRTQAELEAALNKAKPADLIVLVGNGTFKFTESSSPRVEAWESSSPTVVARESSSPRVVARESSSPTGFASKFAPVVLHRHDNAKPNITGAILIEPPRIDTPGVWLDYYGVQPKRGIVTLYKAVNADFFSGWVNGNGERTRYAPGDRPKAADFDPAPRDCGAGLHACAAPIIARQFMPEAVHFIAIPVRVRDLGHPNPDGDTSKIRFKAAAKLVYEVDIDGERIEAASEKAR